MLSPVLSTGLAVVGAVPDCAVTNRTRVAASSSRNSMLDVGSSTEGFRSNKAARHKQTHDCLDADTATTCKESIQPQMLKWETKHHDKAGHHTHAKASPRKEKQTQAVWSRYRYLEQASAEDLSSTARRETSQGSA
jgi:hypothetical protein